MPSALDDARERSPTETAIGRGALDGVVLFSAGLDSTSGIAALREQASRFMLAAYYSGNLRKQQAIAAALGYPYLAQMQAPWARQRESVGGQFWYRSFLFLCIGASLAEAAGASVLYQFENGPLALAVPPAPIYRMTRHAHPLVHQNAEILFREVLGVPIEIRNPFVTLTKKEALDQLRKAVPDRKTLEAIIANSETCWYLRSNAIVGGIGKAVGMPCGVCIPCLVRRTALGPDEVEMSVDLAPTRGSRSTDPVVRIHLDACLDFAKRLLDSSYGVGAFLSDVPEATTLALGSRPGLAPQVVFELYKRFANELVATFV